MGINLSNYTGIRMSKIAKTIEVKYNGMNIRVCHKSNISLIFFGTGIFVGNALTLSRGVLN